MELLDNDKINFIIGEHHVFSQKRPRGGHIVMHLLAYKLAERGQNVYIFAEPMYPHKNITVIPQDYFEDPSPESNIARWSFQPFSYPLHKTVSIFPSDYEGNPFGTIHNARWILDHVNKNVEETWGEYDFYFSNISGFSTNKKKENRYLNVVDYHFNDLYITNENRKGFCYLSWKYTPSNADEIIAPFNPYHIGHWVKLGGYDYLRDVFNKHEYVLTFDTKTFLTQAATLCGCKAIILKSPDSPERKREISSTTYRIENKMNLCGISYGIDDISWANSTIQFSRGFLQDMEKTDNQSVDEFVNFWKERLRM